MLYEPENEVLDAYYLSNVEGNANGAQIIYKNVYIHEFSDEQLVETMDMRVVRVAAPQARFVPVIGDYAELTCSASDIADFPPGRWPVTIMGVHPTSTDVMFRNCAGQCIPHTGVPIERLSPLWLYDQERAEYFYLNGGTAVFASSLPGPSAAPPAMDRQPSAARALIPRDERHDEIDRLVSMYDYGQASGSFKLRTYQETGVRWMLQRDLYGETFENSARGVPPFSKLFGGFLCDDMGLGKTPQALTLIYVTLLRSSNNSILPGDVQSANGEKQLPTLIVSPNTATAMWMEKTREYYPFTTIDGVLHGMRAQLFTTGNMKDLTDLSGNHIFIVSFEQLLSDSNRRKLLSQKKWRRVIIDEGHNIRNKNGKRMKALRALKTDCRWSITGTPLQNRLQEFNSQAEWLQLAKPEQKLIMRRPSPSRECLAEFMLRRTWAHLRISRQIVQNDQIPKPIVAWVNMQLDDRHRALLKQVHDDLKAKSDMTSQVGGTTFGIVTTPILRGQQACAHPSVLLHQQQAVASTSTAASGAGGKKRKTSSDLDLTSIPPCHRFECILSDIMTAITTPRPSNPDEFCKAIVVCKFITELQLYEHLLNERLAKRFPTVEGETPHKVRILTGRGRDQVDKMLEQFEHNFFVPVLLMQFQSGTEALNLQRGNHVFFPSPLWNPFTMMQAIARCHRIGQKDSPVKVKIYWSSGTIEEYIKDKNQLKVDMVVDFLNDPSVADSIAMGDGDMDQDEDKEDDDEISDEDKSVFQQFIQRLF